MDKASVTQFKLLGVPLAATDMRSAIRLVTSWIDSGDKGRMVTFSNAHMLVESLRSPSFSRVLHSSDVNFPDGMPLVWLGRRKAAGQMERICGPEFLPAFSQATEDKRLRHFFYGGAPGVAAKAAQELKRRFPGVQIAGVFSPPFRPMSVEEDKATIAMINEAQPDVVWVCLGCPKQENWIAERRAQLDVPVLLAVGLAVDVLAGGKKRAPSFVGRLGLEWVYRLCQEPRRLWRRYLIYNSIFLYQLLRESVAPMRRFDTEL